MSDSGNIYNEAAKLLCVVSSKKMGFKNAFYSQGGEKNKAVFALVAKCLPLQSCIVDSLYDTKTVNQRKRSHITRLNAKPCECCLLTVVAFELSCCRKAFGMRTAALQILKRHSPQRNIASILRKLIKSKIKESGVQNTNSVSSYPVFLRAIAPIEEVISELQLSTDPTFTLVSYDRESTSYKKFGKLVRSLKKGEFTEDFHFPRLVLVFGASTDLHTCPVLASHKGIIQDKASCIPPLVLLDYLNLPKSHPVVILDACAAPGNKTTLLLSGLRQANQAGRLIALDRDEKRFKQLCGNLRRAHGNPLTINGKLESDHVVDDDGGVGGLLICEAKCCDFLAIDPNDPEFFDITAILLDPTCSSSGLHHKRPELAAPQGDKATNRIQRLANLQAKVLRHALSFPSVQLVVYSTCSIHEQENEAVVREQAQAFSDTFRLTNIWKDLAVGDNISAASPFPSSFSPAAPWKHRGIGGADEETTKCLRSSPEKDLTIGFFVACFKRRRQTKKQAQ